MSLATTFAVLLLGTTLAFLGWGLFWRSQAEALLDENFALRFGDPTPGAEGVKPGVVAVSPEGDGGMDDLLLEVLKPPSVPAQRRPGGAS